MLEFFKYATSDMWVFFGCIILLSLLLHYVINGILRLFTRMYRAIMVSKSGWPPSHLDADGDSVITNSKDINITKN